jgi:membrane protein required for colicin V production
MNLLDIIILSTMGFLILKGLLRGFLREVASLAGVIAGIFLANFFQPQMTKYLDSYLPSMDVLPLISFGGIFLIVMLISSILGWVLKFMFWKVLKGWSGRIIGAGLAAIKGLILIYLVIILLFFFLPAKTPLIATSKLAPSIISSYQGMVGLISPDFYEKWKKKIMGKKKKMDEVLSDKFKDIVEKK